MHFTEVIDLCRETLLKVKPTINTLLEFPKIFKIAILQKSGEKFKVLWVAHVNAVPRVFLGIPVHVPEPGP